MVPKKFGPHGKMVPNQFGHCESGSLHPVYLVKQNILQTICLGGQNWLGTICPWGPNFWGPFVHGDRIGWGPFVQRDQLIGDQLWGTKCPGTICVWDQMCHSPLNGLVEFLNKKTYSSYSRWCVWGSSHLPFCSDVPALHCNNQDNETTRHQTEEKMLVYPT